MSQRGSTCPSRSFPQSNLSNSPRFGEIGLFSPLNACSLIRQKETTKFTWRCSHASLPKLLSYLRNLPAGLFLNRVVIASLARSTAGPNARDKSHISSDFCRQKNRTDKKERSVSFLTWAISKCLCHSQCGLLISYEAFRIPALPKYLFSLQNHFT